MVHKDTLGNEDGISDGELQWMNSGSGIEHEEKVPAANRLLGVQLWLNLPKAEKMSSPTYHSIKNNDIEDIEFDGGKIRLLAGEYKGHKGYKGDHLPLNYYDIHMDKNSEITIETHEDSSVMIFTLRGDVYVGEERINEKTAVKLTKGDILTIKNASDYAQVLFMESKALNEPVAWAGPIVMNTQEEIQEAYSDLRNDTFIKNKMKY